MPDPIQRARQLIASRLAELEAERGKLVSALASMGEGAPSRPRRGRPPKAAAAPRPAAPRGRAAKATSAKAKGAKRAARGQRREELLAAIGADPGARPVALVRAIGVKPAQVHALIGKARAEKLIVKQGKGYKLKG